MTANQDPAMSSEPVHEQQVGDGLTNGTDLAQRIHGIMQDRQVTAEKKMAALLEDPKMVTLLETGQITPAALLYKETATGTAEPPKVHHQKRRHMNSRGGRSYNEGSESEHDPFWNTTPSELSPEQATRSKETGHKVAEALRVEYLTKRYTEDITEGGESYARARLRAKGYVTTEVTRDDGQTVLRIARI